MIGFNGGLIGKANTPVIGASLPGVWTANEQSVAQRIGTWGAYDTDAIAYFSRVEGASGDNQALELTVKAAINSFIVGCKVDGIWSALKSSCILAGARTLNGALQPLVGTSPTNNNFVSGDYTRKTGLLGNASNKYLNANRNHNADPQNSKHLVVYATTAGTNTTAFNSYIGGLIADDGPGRGEIELSSSGSVLSFPLNGTGPSRTPAPNFLGVSRASSSELTSRVSSSSATFSSTSGTPSNMSTFVFARSFTSGGNVNQLNNPINARLSFYSIGESIDLALLDARLTTLMNAFAAIL